MSNSNSLERRSKMEAYNTTFSSDQLALVPYRHQTPDWSSLVYIGLLTLLSLESITSKTNNQTVEDLKLELELARKHIEVLENDIDNFKVLLNDLMKPTDDLDEYILSALLENENGLSAKMILAYIQTDTQEYTKRDINSRLYTLMNKKIVKKSNDKAPIWSLA